MSVWAKRRISQRCYGPILSQFEALFRSLGRPADMVMVAADKTWSDEDRAFHEDILIRLPNDHLLSVFSEFKRIPEPDLPNNAVGLIGHVDQLAKFRKASVA